MERKIVPHTIPKKVKAKVDQMYEGADRKRVIEALESGKTVYSGKVKLRGVKVEKEAGSQDESTPVTPTTPAAASSGKPGKDANK